MTDDSGDVKYYKKYFGFDVLPIRMVSVQGNCLS